MPLSVKTALLNLSVLFLLMLLLWAISLVKRDASIADQFWGVGFVVVGWLTASLQDQVGHVGWTALGLVTIWGLRLASHLTWRKRGEGEDRRYAAMRRQHGERFSWVSLFTVFLLQGVLIWFVSMSLQATLWSEGSHAALWVAVPGVILCAFGIFYETVADLQLARFKVNPRNAGKVMELGVWRYSRHPNYFGDFCVWWGFYLIAASTGAYWAILSPLAMSYLLLRVSGVSLLESTIHERRPEYRRYVRRTNAFFPGPSRDS